MVVVSRSAGAMASRAPSIGLVADERLQGDPQDLGNFFLEGDDGVRPLQLPLESRVVGFELLHARIDRPGLRPSLARAQTDERPLLPLATPVRQERAIQALAAQERAQLAGLLARIGLLHDPEPILDAEAPALDLRGHLGIRHPRSGLDGRNGGSGRPSGSLRLRFRRHINVNADWHAIHPSNPPRPYTNLTREVVSRIIGTGGVVDRRRSGLRVKLMDPDSTIRRAR